MSDLEPQKLIDEAAETLAAAHAELELAMSQVTGAIRADKTMISKTLRSALDRLSAARERVSQLKELASASQTKVGVP